MRLRLLLVAAVVLSSVLHAKADTYTFSFTGSGLNASGTLTTAGDAQNAFSLVTAFTGTQNGSAITLLGVDTFASNSNLFKDASPFYDFSGLSYRVNGVNYNLYANTANQDYICSTCNGGQTDGTLVTFTASAVTATTPEPSSFALLATGFMGVAGAVKRRFV